MVRQVVILFVLIILLVIIGSVTFYFKKLSAQTSGIQATNATDLQTENTKNFSDDLSSLSISSLRKGKYPGSDLVIEETLEPGSNYTRYIASYISEGLKIYGLLTMPISQEGRQRPKSGWPVIIFNHGYIPPKQYRTTERYVAYVDAFASQGYVVFKPDYRGHGDSEGTATGGYGSNAYTIDVLNAVASVKRLNTNKDICHSERSEESIGENETRSFSRLSRDQDDKCLIVDHNRIGMWGHSMGGFITLRIMVVSKDIKAGVIWSGVVASYPDLINNWRRRVTPAQPLPSGASSWRRFLIGLYGEPSDTSPFWQSISSTAFLGDISGPLQLHHAKDDEEVPYEFSVKLEKLLVEKKKPAELYLYDDDNHNISANFQLAMKRSIDFFNLHLK